MMYCIVEIMDIQLTMNHCKRTSEDEILLCEVHSEVFFIMKNM